jgi:hypothetical protein
MMTKQYYAGFQRLLPTTGAAKVSIFYCLSLQNQKHSDKLQPADCSDNSHKEFVH